MSIKVILFDIDGVMIRCPHYFGKELEDQGYENAEHILGEFFKEKNAACTEGKTNIKIEILPYLKRIGWKESVDDFFIQEYAFESQFYDETFDDLIKDIQGQGVYCALASSQEPSRANFFLQHHRFEELFDGYYISCDIGFRKNFGEYWEYTLQDLQSKFPGINPKEIVFFDDQQKIVDKATEFGIQAFLFTDMEQFKGDMNHLGFDIKDLYE